MLLSVLQGPRWDKTVIVLLASAVAFFLLIHEYPGDGASELVGTIEFQSSRILGVRVEIDDAYLDADSGEVSLSRLVVANPAGFSNRDMISVQGVEAHVDFGNRVIDWIRLSGLELEIEFRHGRSNFEVLGEYVQTHSDNGFDRGDRSAARDLGDAPGGVDRREWHVDDVDFVGVRVRVNPDRKALSFELDAEGLSVDTLREDPRDLLRVVTVRFLSQVLLSATRHVDNEHLADRLQDGAGNLELGAWLPRNTTSQ